jgi:AcrR family transcriptional regulator
MPGSRPRPRVRPARKRPGRYHHGNLSRALVQEAVRTIQARGLGHVTLRAVGDRLGVSRTALYRHFADKEALLAAVAAEGFRQLESDIRTAWERPGGGREGLAAMGTAYVRFALTHPSHYRVMFGAPLNDHSPDSELAAAGTAAFQALVNAILLLQGANLMRRDDPLLLSRYIWATVHGVAMLGIDGRVDAESLISFANDRILTGTAV